MKKVIALIIVSILSVNVFAGDTKNHPDKYCAKMKDGKKVIMHQGNPVTTDVILANGTKIQTDGTIIKSNGTKVILKEGECINKDGVIAEEKDKRNKSK